MVQKREWLENGSEGIRSERRNGSGRQGLGEKWLLTSKKSKQARFWILLLISGGLLFFWLCFAFYSWFWGALSPLGICCEKTQGLLQRKTRRHSRFCILAHPWTWTLSYRPLVNIARHGCIIEPGSNMIKSISSVSEHWQECGECVGSDESHVRGNKTLLQCFSQEMKVCTVVPANICF